MGNTTTRSSSSRSVQTDCSASSEPYYSVPVLQNVISPAPGYTSRLYSVQVMSQSELDNMTQYRRLQTQSQCGAGGGAKFNQDVSGSGCDSGLCSGARADPHPQYPSCDSTSNVQITNSTDANSENHSRSDPSPTDKPVNLSFNKIDNK